MTPDSKGVGDLVHSAEPAPHVCGGPKGGEAPDVLQELGGGGASDPPW